MSARQPLADTLFISDFAAFCRTKGDEAYDYFSLNDGPCGCGLTQFFHSLGRSNAEGQWHERHRLVGNELVSRPYTFSALATRLEALIADSPLVERAG